MWLGTTARLGNLRECMGRWESDKVGGVGEWGGCMGVWVWVRKGQRPRVECQSNQTRKKTPNACFLPGWH